MENSLKHMLENETMLKWQVRQGLPQNQSKTWAPYHKTAPNSQLSQDHSQDSGSLGVCQEIEMGCENK